MQGRIDTVEDDFWTERIELFTGQFPTYYTKPYKVWGRFHTSEEQYESMRHEIIPINEKKGTRTYVMMQPYVLEPQLTFTIELVAGFANRQHLLKYKEQRHVCAVSTPMARVGKICSDHAHSVSRPAEACHAFF